MISSRSIPRVFGTVKIEMYAPRWRSGTSPIARRRVSECSPSAPTTWSNRRGAPFSNVTSTPSGPSASSVIESSNTYSTSAAVASWISRLRSHRMISRSSSRRPISSEAGRAAIGRPLLLTYVICRMPVSAAWAAPSSPIRRSTSVPAPRTSTL